MNTDKAETPTMYLRNQMAGFLNADGRASFLSEWGALDETDKATLREWAREEMAVLGVPIKA